MRRLIVCLAVPLLALSACGGETAAPAGPPSLDMRIISEKTGTLELATGTKTVRNVTTAFGYWAAECTAVKEASDPMTGWCDIFPVSGDMPNRNTVIVPYENRATVQYYQGKPPQIALHTANRKAGAPLKFSCGTAHWEAEDKPGHQIAFFYDREAKRFLQQMGASDCELAYTPAQVNAETVIQLPAYGYTEASDYAEKFIAKPKIEPITVP